VTDLLTRTPSIAGNDVEPGNDIERAYAIFIIVGGACFYAIIIGSMSVLVNSLNPTASRHKFKKDMVNNTVRWVSSRSSVSRAQVLHFPVQAACCIAAARSLWSLPFLPFNILHLTNYKK